jgi:hypothetical protein
MSLYTFYPHALRRFWIIAFAAAMLLACSGRMQEHTTEGIRAFYFWQTSLSNLPWNDSAFQSMNIRRIYCRFFDVGWSAEANAPVPMAPLAVYYNAWPRSHELVPVVFITNETFKNIDANQIDGLAKNVHARIMRHITLLLVENSELVYHTNHELWWEQNPYQMKSRHFNELHRYDSLTQAAFKSVTEIQFDCDWTASTRDKYFKFLEMIKNLFSDKLVSSTIRLYQYKYPEQAGVPPVKRGMLMCYNAGDVRDADARNSIFDKREIMSYLETSRPYPVPLDYALPIFRWALLYQNQTLRKILPADDILSNYKDNLTAVDENTYSVKQDFVYGYTEQSTLLRAGDQIRIESPDATDVRETAAWLRGHKNNPQAGISLYHLNEYDLQRYSKEIEAVFNSF